MFESFRGRLALHWLRLELAISRSRRVGNLWLGVFAPDADADEDQLLERVEGAIHLIAEYDPVRYARMQKDLERIWVTRDAYAQGQYHSACNMCVLDKVYVADSETTLVRIAATIVHEATHARLELLGIDYVEGTRARIERICRKAALSFARKVPEGTDVATALERSLSEDRLNDESAWSDETLRRRWRLSRAKMLLEEGAPGWLLKLLRVN